MYNVFENQPGDIIIASGHRSFPGYVVLFQSETKIRAAKLLASYLEAKDGGANIHAAIIAAHKLNPAPKQQLMPLDAETQKAVDEILARNEKGTK